MTETTLQPAPNRQGRETIAGWFARTEAWIDARGKGAWIAATVLAFLLAWPLGLALLAYIIWSKRMFSGPCSTRRTQNRGHRDAYRAAMKTSGNTAFDAYKEETLRRLEQEQEAFEAFLERLREAKDKAEFDQFMEDRARQARAAADAARDDGDAPREPRSGPAGDRSEGPAGPAWS